MHSRRLTVLGLDNANDPDVGSPFLVLQISQCLTIDGQRERADEEHI